MAVRVTATSSQRLTLSSFFTIVLVESLFVLGSGEPFVVSPLGPFGKDRPLSNNTAREPLISSGLS
jgi:hypothetical protein